MQALGESHLREGAAGTGGGGGEGSNTGGALEGQPGTWGGGTAGKVGR